VKQAMVIGDLPFMSYHLNTEQALQNAARFLQEGGAHAVKLEGGVTVAEKVRCIVDCGIPVMGHIGLTPQSVHGFGGFRAQGKTLGSARRIIDDALALEQAGAFSIVLETIPSELADIITRKLSIPTIGIGAGAGCDGQVQVISDLLGLSSEKPPRHAGQYAALHEVIKRAAGEYIQDVSGAAFPDPSHCPHLEESVLDDLNKGLEE
jgi:3-methyl-2-oxobutanoate hydroxymethyltransferase